MSRLAAIAVLLASALAHADSITVTTTTTVETPDPPLQPPALTPSATTLAPPLAPSFRATVAAGPALGFDTKDDCASGECFGLHVEVGGEIAPKLLLLASAALMMAPDAKDRHHVATLAVQTWATSRLWFEGGLGVGSKRTWQYPEAPMMDLSGVAPAGTAAVGFEVLRRREYAFGIQARFASTLEDVHHTSFGQLLAGFSWY